VVYRQSNHDHNGCSDDYGSTDHNGCSNDCGSDHTGSDDHSCAVNHHDTCLTLWLYNGVNFEVIPDDIIGFVYLIINENTGKKYIGKKLFTKASYKQTNGKRKKIRKESDWKTYYGSNNDLLKDVEQCGETKFTRHILRLCKTKGECNYFEAKEQFDRNVLLRPDLYYNHQIRLRVHRSHLKNLVV
jgi:hypothetical protein